MKPVTNSKELVRGAMILTVAALVTKILSAIYRVPFQNIVGDVGFYIYQQIYPFYGVVLVLTTYGFPVVISKLYTELQVKGKVHSAERMLVVSLVFLTLIGITFFSFFYFGASWLAGLMGDPHLDLLFKMVSIPFLIFPFISVLRGYFQGKGNMVPTAVSQVGEQLIRVATILFLSAYFVQRGSSLYLAGSGAVFGSVTGGLVSFLILVVFFLKKREGISISGTKRKLLLVESIWVMKALVIQGFAISVSGMLLILFQMADSFNLYSSLLDLGMSDLDAKTAKGIFDRGQPLIQLGTVVATSMSLSLVPAISGGKERLNHPVILEKIRLALQTSLLFGAAAAAGLFTIIRPVNIMLFENADGSDVLAVLSLMILLGSVTLTVTSILQGLDFPIFPAVLIVGGFGLKYGLNLFLVSSMGTMGAAIATLLSLAVILMALVARLRFILRQRILSVAFMGKVGLSSILMGIFLHYYLNWTNGLFDLVQPVRMAAAIQALSAVAFGAILYFVSLLIFKALEASELENLPFGSRILQVWIKKSGGRMNE